MQTKRRPDLENAEAHCHCPLEVVNYGNARSCFSVSRRQEFPEITGIRYFLFDYGGILSPIPIGYCCSVTSNEKEHKVTGTIQEYRRLL